MKKARHFFLMGAVGLLISLLALPYVESGYVAYVMPWLVFLIIGITTHLKYVRK